MQRRKIQILFFVLFLCFIPLLAEAAEESQEEEPVSADSIIEEQLHNLSLGEIQKIVDELNQDLNELMPEKNLLEMIKDFITSGLQFDWQLFFETIVKRLFKEVFANTWLLGELLILTVIASLLKTFQDAFNSQGIAQVSNGVVYLVLVVIAINSFMVASQIGSDAISRMTDFMNALLPTLFTLLVGTGAVGSATIFQPIIFLLVSAIATIIQTVVFPLIFLAVILTVVSSLTGEFRLSKMGGFIKQIGLTVLGLSFIIFFGVILIQGAAVSVADGISLRTAKYLTSTFVPVVGGMFANSLELIVGCSLLIQNAVGLIGMLMILVTVAFPIIKILALVLIYKLVSAVIQPIGDSLIVDCINSLGNTLMLVFISVTTVAIMFFIFITIMLGVGNMTVMLR